MSEFRNSFGENIFRLKYAASPSETWHQRAITIVDSVCGTAGGKRERPLLGKEERDQLIRYITEFKFLPGGRYIYYAGRKARFFNNCAVGSTKLLTDKGWVRFKDVVGENINIYSPVEKTFLPAIMHYHGEQEVFKYTFKSGTSKRNLSVKFTEDHKWPTANRGDVEDLQVGDKVSFTDIKLPHDDIGYLHGAVFADGSEQQLKRGYCHQLRLCGKKKEYLSKLKGYTTVSYPPFSKGDPLLYIKSDYNMKNLPYEKDLSYISSFIKGWLDFDGHSTEACMWIHSINKEGIEWLKENACLAGYGFVSHTHVTTKDSNFGPRKPLYDIRLYKSNHKNIEVVSKEFVGIEEVFCPYEPTHNRIVIDHGIDTYQCYLLRAEEDTREEWGRLAERASSCLMTGGGIGASYSRLRGKGLILSRTGGNSSGPLPLMYILNEVGRNVMQGGSRRSAIYASLAEEHPDIYDFLHSKNWGDMPIGGNGMTLADAKMADFNFPAPLDMTNISVEYGTKWLEGARERSDVFRENCLQAMRTGEPGFSFNFYEQENEVLRNAPLGPDTHVLTKEGYVTIEETEGRETTIWTGKRWVPTHFKKTKEDTDVIKVYISGGREIVADPSHDFFLEDGTKKQAGSLKIGDNLLIQLNDSYNEKKLEKMWYTFGYIYGDGSFSKKYPRAEITFCTEESKNCLDSCDKYLFTSITLEDKGGYTRAYTGSDNLFRNRQKSVFPKDMNHRSDPAKASFIAGLFDADGNYTSERHTVRVASKHYEFLEDTRRLLESLGILSGISTSGISSYGGNVGYMLTVYSEYTTRFSQIIPTNRLKVEEYTPYRKTKLKVRGVEEFKTSDVYCCDVKVEEHSFMAEGVIVSNCTEVTSEDDSDCCNLGSVNIGNIDSLDEMRDVVNLATKFLVCGTVRSEVPYLKVAEVREKNRRLGLGLMGIHEWLLKRGHDYEVGEDLRSWLQVYKDESIHSGLEHCERLYLSPPVAFRAIAPVGSIGILAGTTTAIEPMFAVAYKRRYLTEGTKWKYEYVVDSVAETLIQEHGIDPDSIQTSLSLASDVEKRVKFQADVQDYVDMSISSTINLPPWGSKLNNEDRVDEFAGIIGKYAHRLRGITCYPDGGRGGQPLTVMPYADAMKHKGVVFEENDICDISGKGGSCGS